MKRFFRLPVLLCLAMVMSSCGFHLRQAVKLPPSLQRIHVSVNGTGNLERNLVQALQGSGITVEDDSGPGIAELKIPLAQFSTQILTVSGFSRVTEYAVHYDVRFDLLTPDARALLSNQTIDMQRSYSYDATNTVGNDAQVEQIQQSLIDDMVQAILFRIQAAAARVDAGSQTPANGAVPTPAPASDKP